MVRSSEADKEVGEGELESTLVRIVGQLRGYERDYVVRDREAIGCEGVVCDLELFSTCRSRANG
jgi:hypothetical protein